MGLRELASDPGLLRAGRVAHSQHLLSRCIIFKTTGSGRDTTWAPRPARLLYASTASLLQHGSIYKMHVCVSGTLQPEGTI